MENIQIHAHTHGVEYKAIYLYFIICEYFISVFMVELKVWTEGSEKLLKQSEKEDGALEKNHLQVTLIR